MGQFEYTGQLPSGAAVTGTIEAADAAAATESLAGAGFRLLSLAPAAAMPMARPLSRDDVFFFNEQLASLAQTGMALDQGLRMLAKDLRRGRLKAAVETLADELERGVPLEKAVEARPGLFPPLYADVLKAGARSNQLGSTLTNLSTHLKLMGAGRRLFWESAIYPIIVLVLAFGLLSFFMVYIAPQFEAIYGDFMPIQWSTFGDEPSPGSIVPGPTGALLAVARHWNLVMIGVLGLVALTVMTYVAMGRSLSGLRVREALVGAMPGIGRVRRMSLLARFAQAAALGARSGQDLPMLLRLASGATGSRVLMGEADVLARAVEAGASPAAAAVHLRLIPQLFGYTVQVAGNRGQLAEALAEMARAYDELARHRLAMFKMLVMPFFILGAAMTVGLGIFALIAPLFTLINNMTGG